MRFCNGNILKFMSLEVFAPPARRTAALIGIAYFRQDVTDCAVVVDWGVCETCAIATNQLMNSKIFDGMIGLLFVCIHIGIGKEERFRQIVLPW